MSRLNWLLGGVADALEEANNLLIEATKEALTALEELITNTPYPQTGPEDDAPPALLEEPHGEVWSSLYDVYHDQIMEYVLLTVGIFLIITYFFRVAKGLMPRGYDSTKTIKDLFTVAFISVFWWPIAVLILSLSAFFAELLLVATIDGDGEAGLAAVYDILDAQVANAFGSGSSLVTSIVLLIPFILKAALMILLITLWIIRYVSIFLITPVVPVFLMLNALDFPGVDYVGGLGKIAAKAYVALVFLSIPAALVITMFSVIAQSMTPLVEGAMGVEGASEPEAAMVLADGAGVASVSGELISAVMLVFIGVALAIAMPLVAAGGPFAMVYASKRGSIGSLSGLATGDLSLGDVAKDSSGVAGSALETGRSVTNSARGKVGEYETAHLGEDEELELSERRFGGIRSRLNSIEEKANNYKEASAAERARYGRDKGVEAGQAGVEMGREGLDRASEIEEILEEKAIDAGKSGVATWQNPKTMARIAEENARNRVSRIKGEAKQKLEDTKGARELMEETGGNIDEYLDSTYQDNVERFSEIKAAKQKVEDEFTKAEDMDVEDLIEEYGDEKGPLSDEEKENIAAKDTQTDVIENNMREIQGILQDEGIWEDVKNGDLTIKEGLKVAKRSDKAEIIKENGMGEMFARSDRNLEEFFSDWTDRDRIQLGRREKLEVLEQEGVKSEWEDSDQTLDEFFKEWRPDGTKELDGINISEKYNEALEKIQENEEMTKEIKSTNRALHDGMSQEDMSELIEHTIEEEVSVQAMHQFLSTSKVIDDVRENVINKMNNSDDEMSTGEIKEAIQTARREEYDKESDVPDEVFAGISTEELSELVNEAGKAVKGEEDYIEQVVGELETTWAAEENNERYQKQKQQNETGTTITREEIEALEGLDKPVDEVMQEIADGSYEELQSLLNRTSIQDQMFEEHIEEEIEKAEEKQEEYAERVMQGGDF